MNNTALITGASSGIGRELALIHAEQAGDLVIIARSEDKLNELKKEIEEKFKREVKIIVKDLSNVNSAKEIYDEVQNSKIEIDYLINNAGFGGLGKFHERSLEQDLNMINVNIIALTALSKLFLPNFVERNNGKILNVSSTASLFPGPLQAVYFATKAFAASLSNAIAGELTETNVTVTNLMPGATNTGFAKAANLESTSLFSQTASARSVAEAGYNGMMAGKLDVIAGVTTMQKFLFSLIPFLSKKRKLKMIREIQEVTA